MQFFITNCLIQINQIWKETGKPSKKKIAEKETLVHSYLPLSLPCLNGTSRMGTYKIGHWPPPPSSNRDKLHFSRDELGNTHWPSLILSGMVLGLIQFFFNIIFCNLPLVKDNYAKMYIIIYQDQGKFKSTTLLCDIENFHSSNTVKNCEETELNMGHVTKSFWPLPP